jgi:hypothetical protein
MWIVCIHNFAISSPLQLLYSMRDFYALDSDSCRINRNKTTTCKSPIACPKTLSIDYDFWTLSNLISLNIKAHYAQESFLTFINQMIHIWCAFLFTFITRGVTFIRLNGYCRFLAKKTVWKFNNRYCV